MKRLLAQFVLVAALVSVSAACAKDPDPLGPALIKYSLLCPSGKNACYANCGTRYDINGNGMIDASELPEFNSCTGTCNSLCDTTAILLALSD